jgi:hypothetical protein
MQVFDAVKLVVKLVIELVVTTSVTAYRAPTRKAGVALVVKLVEND